MGKSKFVTVKALRRALEDLPASSRVMVAPNEEDEPEEARVLELGTTVSGGRTVRAIILSA